MKHGPPASLLAAVLALAPACDPGEPPPRGDSRDFALEVDEQHARNQELHERSQQLDRRLTVLAPQVEELRGELATVSAEWARDASLELDGKLATARQRVSDLRAATGFDLQAMAGAAEEALDELAETYDETRERLAPRS